MSREAAGLDVDAGVRAMLRLMPRLVGRAKRIPVPERLREFSLAPRHLSLLVVLLYDGPATVGTLAQRLELAPATVSLMVGELSRYGVLSRREDEADRRRTIVDIADEHRDAVHDWLATGADAWREALAPLTSDQRALIVDTLLAYESAVDRRSGLIRWTHRRQPVIFTIVDHFLVGRKALAP